MNVLVVEDELLQAFAVMDSLEAGGHTAIGPAPDSTAAIHFAQRSRPDLALVDFSLAHGDMGFEVARELRERFDVPVVFMTANSDGARAHRDSAIGCVQKPTTTATILRSVDAAAELAEGRRPVELPSAFEVYE